MPRRIDIELTSARPDGSWTWRAAGALKPRGVLDGKLLTSGAKPGDVLRVDAEFEIEGITIVNVLPPKEKRSEPERLEIIGPPRAQTPGVTTSLARPPRDGDDNPRPRRGEGSRDGGERPPARSSRPPREGSDRGGGSPRPSRGDRPRIDRGSRPGGPLGSGRGSGERSGGGRGPGDHAGGPVGADRGADDSGRGRRSGPGGEAAEVTTSGDQGDVSGAPPAGDRGVDPTGSPRGRDGGSRAGGRDGRSGGPGGSAGGARGRRPGGVPGDEHRPGGPPRSQRPGRAGRDHPAAEAEGAPSGGRSGPSGPERHKPRRLNPGSTHRHALLDTLPPEHRPIAEQVIRGGIPAVRTAIHLEGEKAAAEGRPAPNAQALLAIAEELLPKVKAAEWRDRAEAAAKVADELPLRELRSLLDGASAARDDESRSLAANLRETLERRGEALRTGWVEEIQTNLSESRVVRALRLSARPPEATTKLPADLAAQLTDAASKAMSPDTPSDRWAAMLDAVAASPVRRQVKPLGLPADAKEPLLQAARQQSARVPALAPMLGITMPPPPGPVRPSPPPTPASN